MKPKCKINSLGDKFWYLDGKLHREDGPAIELINGTKEWYLNDLLHREDGPACEYSSGDKEWWIDGYRHREDGPAVEWSNGYKEWRYKDKRISCQDNEEFLKIINIKVF